MLPAPIPADEDRRLALIADCRLRNASVAGFPELATVAARVARTPIALVTVVDRECELVLAEHGFSASTLMRDESVCAHLLVEPNEMLIVEDLSLDGRFAENPLVVGAPFLRFYAGVPLLRDGVAVAILCVLDYRPRLLAPDQIETVRRLGAIGEHLIELHRLHTMMSA